MYFRENEPETEAAPRGVPPWELVGYVEEPRRRRGGTRVLAAFTAFAMLFAIAVPAFLVLEHRMGPGSSIVFFSVVGLLAAGMVQFLRRRER